MEDALPHPSRIAHRRWPLRLAWCSLAATVALAMGLIVFANPLNDDFSRAQIQPSAWFSYIFDGMYREWTGRWAGVGLAAFVLPRVDPTRYYGLLLGALHVAQWAALLVFWRLLLGPCVSWRRPGALVLATYAVLWSAAPAPGETYYWFSGGVEYSLSISLAILLVGALVRACGRKDRARWFWAALAGALALIVPGMHETIGLALCLILFTGLGIALRLRRGVTPALGVAMLAVAGTLFSALAPGNAKRAMLYEHYGDLRLTLHAILHLMRHDVIPWLRQPVLLAAVAALLLTPFAGARRPAWARQSVVPWHWIFPAVTLAVLVACLAAPSWAAAIINGRGLNATQEFCLLGACATAVAWGRRLNWLRPWLARPMRGRLRVAAWLVLAAGLWVTGNNRRALIDLATTMPAWSRTLKQQQSEARRARAAGRLDAIVPALAVTRPALFFEDGLCPDPQDWRNRHFAAYFGLRSVRTAPASTKTTKKY